MSEAVEALAKRKYAPGAAYNEGIPGAWKDSSNVRKSAHYASQDFKECAAVQAQYIYDTYGKSPATVPSIFASCFCRRTTWISASMTIVSSQEYTCLHMQNA
jgi:hypothetical protein